MADFSLRVLSTAVDRFWRERVVGPFRLFGVRIDGVEVTQSIQHYRAASHLTDPADRGPDNSIRLVAKKSAWVRVYLRSGLLPSTAGVSGTLTIARRNYGFLWFDAGTYSPQPPGSVTAPQTANYTTERGSTANTLNFVIPASAFWGYLRLTVRITGSGGSELDHDTLHVDATLLQTLRVRAILVSYNGPSTSSPPPGSPPTNLNLAAPTLANVQTEAGLALRMMPVQATGSFASAGTVAWNLPLDDPRSCPGCCSPNWNALLTTLTNTRTNDGNRTDVVYYGLLPAAIPVNVPGCGQGGLGSAPFGLPNTFVHEIGHGYGFQHTPCGNTGAADPNYPTYQPYPSGSIGEFGLDIANGNVLPPAGTSDYMSYCAPRWMSLYQYNRLVQHARLDPRWLRDDPWWKDYRLIPKWTFPPEWWLPDPPPEDPWRWFEMRRTPVISIVGIVHGPGRLEVTTVARVAAAGPPPGDATGMVARLLDAEGDEMARGVVYRLPAHAGCGCDDDGHRSEDPSPYTFQAFIPDVGRGASVRVDRGDETVWERKAPDQDPEIERFDAQVGKDGALSVGWDSTAGEDAEAWLQWSDDEGRGWHGLATGLTGGSAEVALAGIPAGRLLVRLLVHDGFSTAASEPAEIEVPGLGPQVAVLHPGPGQTLRAGGPMQLWASITDQAGGAWEGEEGWWELDGREVGRGADLWITAPAPGEHRVRFAVRYDRGTVDQTVEFVTVGPEKQYDVPR